MRLLQPKKKKNQEEGMHERGQQSLIIHGFRTISRVTRSRHIKEEAGRSHLLFKRLPLPIHKTSVLPVHNSELVAIPDAIEIKHAVCSLG